MKGTPEELDRIANVVLRYRPKPKTKAERRKIRREKREARKISNLTPVQTEDGIKLAPKDAPLIEAIRKQREKGGF